MAVIKKRKKRIVVSPSMRKSLADKFGVTVQCIGGALRFATEGFQPEEIRKAAIEMGGVETTEVVIVEQ